MIISLNLLKKYVNIDELSTEEIINDLTMLGHAVESYQEKSKFLDDKIVVGELLEVGQHPNASKLTVCKVNIGSQILQIVCGAMNHKVGDKVIVATIGAIIQGKLEIKPTVLRGIESNGMLCSEEEIGLRKYNDGVMILDRDAVVGLKASEHLFNNDVIFDLEITPNRPDCLSHIGIARELGAKYNKKISYPLHDFWKNSNKPSTLKVNVLEKDLCKRYSSILVEGVTVKRSPDWLRMYLEIFGIKSINNIVDIGNFIMMNYGHPIHMFDYDKITGKEINVRLSKNGEKIKTLDSIERELDDKTLVIADREKILSIAGIIGGVDSAITLETKNIIVEVANFDESLIRATSKLINVSTESSYRFERGTDRKDNINVISDAIHMVIYIASAEIRENIMDINYYKDSNMEFEVNIDKLNSFLGLNLSPETIHNILFNLNLTNDTSEGGRLINITVPSYRIDIAREVDIYEEVARIYGYDRIEPKSPINKLQYARTDEMSLLLNKLKTKLSITGLNEVINYSFLPRNFNVDQNVEILNPINEEMVFLRSELTYSLLKNINHNLNNGMSDIKIFELSRVFGKDGEEVFKLGVALAGKGERSLWLPKPVDYDFYTLKGYIEDVLSFLGIIGYNIISSENKKFHSGISANISHGGKLIGSLGEIHPKLCSELNINKKVYIADIDISEIYMKIGLDLKYNKISRYPIVQRDLAILFKEEEQIGPVLDDIAKVSKNLTKLEVFDIYRGEQVGANVKSVAIALLFKSEEKTLTDEEVSVDVEGILEMLLKKYNAPLRWPS